MRAVLLRLPLLLPLLLLVAATLAGRGACDLPRPVVPVGIVDSSILENWFPTWSLYLDAMPAHVELPANVTLDATPVNTGFNNAEALSATLRLSDVCDDDAGVALVFGPSYSGAALNAALMARETGVPLLSPTATNAALANRADYPTFSRCLASDSLDGRLSASVVAYFGWARAGVISHGETYGTYLAAAFTSACAALGVSVLASHKIETNVHLLPAGSAELESAREDVRAKLRLVKAAGVRVVYFAGISEWWVVMEVAEEEGMTGAGWVWILCSGAMPSTVTEVASGERTAALAASGALDGVLGTTPFYGGTAEFDALAAVHAASGGALALEPSVWNTLMWDTVALGFRAIAALLAAEDDCSGGGGGGGGGGSAADACALLANTTDNGERLVWFLRNTPFEGASGRVVLSADGERLGSFFVTNLRFDAGADPLLGEVAVVGVADGAELEVTIDAEVRWPGGATDAVPADRPTVQYEVREISGAVGAGVTAVAAVVAALALACAAFTAANKHRLIISMSSPRINNVLSGGVAAVAATVALVGVGPRGDGWCRVNHWLFPAAFSLAVAPLVAKTWRVHRIYNSRRLQSRSIGDSTLFAFCGVVLALDAAMVCVWQSYDPLVLRTRELPGAVQADGSVVVPLVRECSSRDRTVWVSALLAAKGALLLYGAVLAYQVRDVTIAALNDSKWVGWATYATLVSFAFAVPVSVVLRDQPSDEYAIVGSAALFSALALLALVHGPKMAAVANGREAAWTGTAGAGGISSLHKRAPSGGGSRGSGADAAKARPRANRSAERARERARSDRRRPASEGRVVGGKRPAARTSAGAPGLSSRAVAGVRSHHVRSHQARPQAEPLPSAAAGWPAAAVVPNVVEEDEMEQLASQLRIQSAAVLGPAAPRPPAALRSLALMAAASPPPAVPPQRE